MRLLVICHEFPPIGGGGGRNAYQLAVEFAKSHEVDVLTSAAPKLKSKEVIEGLQLYRVGLRRNISMEVGAKIRTYIAMGCFTLAALIRGLFLCRRRKYDAVWTHFAIPSGLIGVLLSRLFGISHVCTIIEADILDVQRNCAVSYTSPLLKATIAWVLKSTRRLVAISSSIKMVAHTDYGTTTEIEVIPCGIPEPNVPRARRSELGFADSDFIAAFVGRFVARKGLRYLIEAIATLKELPVKLFLIGDGPEKPQLDALAKKLGLADRVLFLGQMTDENKYRYLSMSDIFVLPSIHEGFGIVLLEAMYFGLPLVSTNCGGPADIVRDGENGFLVPTEDPKALADRIRFLYENEKIRRQISANNTRRFDQFGSRTLAERYERLISESIHHVAAESRAGL